MLHGSHARHKNKTLFSIHKFNLLITGFQLLKAKDNFQINITQKKTQVINKVTYTHCCHRMTIFCSSFWGPGFHFRKKAIPIYYMYLIIILICF